MVFSYLELFEIPAQLDTHSEIASLHLRAAYDAKKLVIKL